MDRSACATRSPSAALSLVMSNATASPCGWSPTSASALLSVRLATVTRKSGWSSKYCTNGLATNPAPKTSTCFICHSSRYFLM